MKKLTIILALITVMLTPTIAQASTITCKTYGAYQDDVAALVSKGDYFETMQDFAKDPTNVLALSPAKLKLYGSAMLEFSDDLQSMKHVDPKMQAYHDAAIDLFGITGRFMVDAASVGVIPAAMVYDTQLTRSTDAYNRELKTIPANCGASI